MQRSSNLPSLRLSPTLLLLGLALPAFGLQLGLGSVPSPNGEPQIGIKITLEQPTGDELHGMAHISIPAGWHIQSGNPKDEFAIATKLQIDSLALQVSRVDYPPDVEREFTFSPGTKKAVYDGEIDISFTAKRLQPDGPLKAVLSYQACNDHVCLRPKSISVNTTLTASVLKTAAPRPAPIPSNTNFSRLGASHPQSFSGMLHGDLRQTFESHGIALTLLVIFVAGLLLNLTPCVYPLIPLTVGFFSSQTEGRRGRRVGLSVLYVLGLAFTYSILGVFSALSGRLFGAWLQLPAVLIFFAGLMLVLSLSMFGLYDIRVPHFLSDRAGARAGYVGSLTMGLLAGVVAAPCVGPFIISLIALVAQIGSPGLGFLLFFVLALGLGFPFLLLGIFSTAVNSMPRSGGWMVTVKQAMGFVLVAMSFYFVRPLLGDRWFYLGAGLSLLAGAIFLFFRRDPSGRGRSLSWTCATVLLIAAVWCFWPRTHGEEMSWVRFDDAALAKAKGASKPVMIDFYADWCTPCKELDAHTFTDTAVAREAERFVRLKADLTKENDATVKAVSTRFSIIGVPTVVLLDGSGNEIDRLTGFEAPGPFAERLKRLR
ncbi:MAG TPA: cytochrome c biogenesis protein CcdA [Thermoanaerobaculia bacterium]|nr:cytochrome c biogenesis protein CcdA [Thermoanaerobaculia bacterium]